MTITQQISIDLQQPGSAPVVHAVQGEEYTREVKVTLYSGGVSWTPPSGCEVAIRYGKPDGKGGIYDKLPDNTTAWSILNNTISITLAPQMLTVAGIVNAQVEIIINEKEILSTFHFIVDVEEDASMGAVKSENYTNWKSFWFPQTTGAKAGQYVKVTRVDSDGHVLAVSPTNEPNETNQLATNAKNTAESANSKAEQATTLANKAQSTANSALEKANAALPANSLPDVIKDALAQAKESGEFDGEDGENGKNGSNGLSVLAVNITAGDAQKIEVYPDNVIENEGALFPRDILIGDKVLTQDGKIFIVTSYGTKFDATTGSSTTYYSAKFLVNAGGSVKSVNGVTPDENGNVEITIPEKSEGTEVFNKADLPKNPQYTAFVNGVEYYGYFADETNFTWNNPYLKKGPVTITARGMLKDGKDGNTKLKTIYDDGTYGPDLRIVVDGVSTTVVVTTDPSKTLAKITGDSEYQGWVLLDMTVMSVVHLDSFYVKSVNGVTPDENGNVEIKIPEGSVGVFDYTELTNKPSINGVEVSGNKTSADYGIGNPTNEQVGAAVEAYLIEHPEATTTVADGSVTPNKTSFLKQYKLNLYDASKVTAGRFDNASDTDYMTSDYIPVKKAVYAASTRPWYAELYKDGVVVKNFVPSTATIDLTQYDVEFNQIRLATYGSSVPGNMMFSEGTLPDSYIAYDAPENIKTDITDDSVKKCFGDSAYEHVKNQGIVGLIEEHSLPANRLDFGVNHVCNLCDFSKVSEGYVGADGTLVSSDVYTTDFIPVEEGATYYGLGTFLSGLYDADKNFIRNFIPNTDFVDGGYTIPAGEGVAYIRSSGVGKNTVITKGFKALSYIAPTPSFRMLDDYARVDIRAYLLGTYGQRWFAVGDSITRGSMATTNYVNVICQNWLYGGTNYGIPGTRLTSTSGNGDGMCERIKTYDETKCDIITVCGGINDKNNGVTIGTMDDTDTATVYGALKDICNTFLTKYAGKRCGFITPLKYNTGETSNVTEAIKEVAAYYNIPVLDMESEFGYLFNYTDDVKNAYTVDGLHPNAAGQELMARKIGAWMLTL